MYYVVIRLVLGGDLVKRLGPRQTGLCGTSL